MWRKEVVELLLLKYQEHENLYNVRHPDYPDRVKRSDSISQIHEELKEEDGKITMEDIKRKVHTLRSQYLKELREITRSRKIGKTYEPKLWCFHQLNFLKEHCTSRKTSSNVSNLIFENSILKQENEEEDDEENQPQYFKGIERYEQTCQRSSSVCSASSTEDPISIATTLRYDEIGHWVVWGEKGRCHLCRTGNPLSKCSKCGVHLCSNMSKNCFVSYHT